MDRLKIFIVDDERLARDELRFLLGHHPEAVVVGEAGGVKDASEAIAQLHPDVIFLDLQLRGESGLDLLAHLEDGSRVIFVTGFEERALKELESQHWDYLLKPVNPTRLRPVIQQLTREMH